MECREERSCVSLNKHWSTVDPGDSLVVFLVRVVELWLPGGEGAVFQRRALRSCCVIEGFCGLPGVAAYAVLEELALIRGRGEARGQSSSVSAARARLQPASSSLGTAMCPKQAKDEPEPEEATEPDERTAALGTAGSAAPQHTRGSPSGFRSWLEESCKVSCILRSRAAGMPPACCSP